MGKKVFFLKIGGFLLFNLILLFVVLIVCSGRHRNIHFPVQETESNLFSILPDKHYKVVLLGTSRGRVFSRDANHSLMEKTLGAEVANLSKGGGGGLMPAELHLKHFFDRGSTTDHIVYLIDPWVFFAAINNEENEFFLRDEPFELSIFLHLLKDRYPLHRLSSYLQMIPDRDWAELSRYKEPGMDKVTLKAIDPEKQEEARSYYQKTYLQGNFQRYSGYLDKIAKLAQEHDCQLTFIMLPILMDNFPGADRVDMTLQTFTGSHTRWKYYNLISTMQDRHFFYDHMHFNRRGVYEFCKGVLKPVITGTSVSPPVWKGETGESAKTPL